MGVIDKISRSLQDPDMANIPKPRPDKAKVIDEVWTDERIRSFLGTRKPSYLGTEVPGDSDYYVLLRAYQAMRIQDFQKFLEHFESAGGNLLAEGPNGKDLLKYIQNHRKAAPFIEALQNRLKT